MHALDDVGEEVGDRQHREFVQVLVGKGGGKHWYIILQIINNEKIIRILVKK